MAASPFMKLSAEMAKKLTPHPMAAAAAKPSPSRRPDITILTSSSSHHLETGSQEGTLKIQFQVQKLYNFSDNDSLGFSRRTFSDELLFPLSVLADPTKTFFPFTAVFSSAKVDSKHWMNIAEKIFAEAEKSHVPNTRQQLEVDVKIEVPMTGTNIYELRRFRVGDETVVGDCSICLQELSSGGALRQLTETTRCFHVFHSSCLREWLVAHDSCPMCRRRVII